MLTEIRIALFVGKQKQISVLPGSAGSGMAYYTIW